MKFRILTLQNIAVSGVAIWATAPIFAYGGAYRVIVALLVLVWFVLEAARRDGLVRHPTRRGLLVLAYILCLSAIELLFGKRGVTEIAQLYIFIFFLGVYESRRRDILSLTPVFWCVMATMPIWMYTTYGALRLDSGVARMLVRNSQEAMEFSSQGVGGYGLVYLSALLMPVWTSLVWLKPRQLLVGAHPGQARRYATKIALWACIVFGAALIVSAGYSIALYCAVLGVAFSVALARGVAKWLVIRALIVVIVSVIALAYLPNILQLLLVIMEGTLFEKKISDLLNSLQGTSAAGTLGDRVNLYLRSLELFMQNPVLGTMQSGGHSAFLDQFARYGLLIGALSAWLVYFVPLRYLRAGGPGIGISIAFLAVLLPVTIFNTLAGSFGIAVFVMFPVAAAMIRRSRLAGQRPDVAGAVA